MKKCVSFDDVLVTPKFSDIISRSEIDLSSFLGSIKSEIPIISSPMDTVTEARMANRIASLGGIGIIHRNLKIRNQSEEVNKVKKKRLTFVKGSSLG